jgi:hypothetical protein
MMRILYMALIPSVHLAERTEYPRTVRAKDGDAE